MTEHTHVGFSVGHRIMDMEGIRPMSDTLRTRIAAAINAVWDSGYPDAPADALADVVIAELNANCIGYQRTRQ